MKKILLPLLLAFLTGVTLAADPRVGGVAVVPRTDFQTYTNAARTNIEARITGPASAVDNTVPRFDGTTGKLTENSQVSITDTGSVGIGTAVPNILGGAAYPGRVIHIHDNTQASIAVSTTNGFASVVWWDGAAAVNEKLFEMDVAGGSGVLNIVSGTDGGTIQSYILRMLPTGEASFGVDQPLVGTALRVGGKLVTSGRIGGGVTLPFAPLHIVGTNIPNGEAFYTAIIEDQTPMALGTGGGIGFGGKYNAAGERLDTFASIQGIKENATDGNYAGALLFITRVMSGAPTERARISSVGNLGVHTNDPPWDFTVNGTNATFGRITLNGTNIEAQISAQIAAEAGGSAFPLSADANANLFSITNAKSLQSTGTVAGDVGSFRDVNVTGDFTVGGTLYLESLIVTNRFQEFAASANHQIDGSSVGDWIQTNSMAENTALYFTNYTGVTNRYKFHIILKGAASGGANYIVTNIVQAGDLLSIDEGPLSQSATLTVSNGTRVELDGFMARIDGTNQMFIYTTQRSIVGVVTASTNTVFAAGTRYTNQTARYEMPASSWTLNGAVAGTAAVTLYVEHSTVTNKLTVSAGPLESLTIVEALSGLIVGPGEVFRYENETTGSGATVAVVPNTCSRQQF